MMSAMKAAWIATLIQALYGQVDSSQLNAKYGPPVEEVFKVRPNVALAVSYGDQRQICKLELHPVQFDGVIKLALIDELVKEISPPGAAVQTTGRICAGFCFRFSESPDFWISQADQDVRVSQHHFGEGWFAIIQFKSCRE